MGDLSGSRMPLSGSRPEVGPPKITGEEWTLTRSVCTRRPHPDLPQIDEDHHKIHNQSEVGQIPDPHHICWYQLRSPLHIGGTQVRSTAQSEPPEDPRQTHRPKPLPLRTIAQQLESYYYDEILHQCFFARLLASCVRGAHVTRQLCVALEGSAKRRPIT